MGGRNSHRTAHWPRDTLFDTGSGNPDGSGCGALSRWGATGYHVIENPTRTIRSSVACQRTRRSFGMAAAEAPESGSFRVCVVGVTGEVGRLLAKTILAQEDMFLASAVARSAAGQSVGQVLDCECPVEIRSSVSEALAKDRFDVLVDYTSAKVAYENVRAALSEGVYVIDGSSGVT